MATLLLLVMYGVFERDDDGAREMAFSFLTSKTIPSRHSEREERSISDNYTHTKREQALSKTCVPYYI